MHPQSHLLADHWGRHVLLGCNLTTAAPIAPSPVCHRLQAKAGLSQSEVMLSISQTLSGWRVTGDCCHLFQVRWSTFT